MECMRGLYVFVYELEYVHVFFVYAYENVYV